MKKLKVKYNGADVEVEVPDEVILPEEAGNYVTKEFMQGEMTKRVAQAKRGLVNPDEVLEDGEFKAKAMTVWGLTGKGKVSDEDIAKLTKSIEEQKVAPLMKEVEKLKGDLGSLYERDRDLQILDAARAAGVSEVWLTPPTEKSKAPIINVLAPYFGQSAEHGNGWFLKEGDGFAYAKTPTSNTPYKAVAEFVPEFVTHESRAKTFLADNRQRVPGGKAPAAPAAPGTVNRRDPVEFGRNLEDIAKGKVTVTP